MKTEIEFNMQWSPQNSIDIDNIGDCAIECFNEKLEYNYYILIDTDMGMSGIYTWGPVLEDNSMLLPDFTFNFTELEYKESKIIKNLNKYINNMNRGITHAKLISKKEALEHIPELAAYIPTGE